MAGEDAVPPPHPRRPRQEPPREDTPPPPPPPPPPPNSPVKNGTTSAGPSGTPPTTNTSLDIMNNLTSPTPRPLQHHPSSHKTMEQRLSQCESELQQAISARQSNRSTSVVERDEQERVIHVLQQELARCKVTIQAQSQVIQNPQSGHRPLSQQHFENRSAHCLPGRYPGTIPPPLFDPAGSIEEAKSARMPNTYNPTPHAKPTCGSQTAPTPPQNVYNQGFGQQGSNFSKPLNQQVVSPPQTNLYPASLPGTLGYGLIAEQRAQPLTPAPIMKQRYGGYFAQNGLTSNSLQPIHSQPSSNQPSYSSPSRFPAVPQQQAGKPTQAMSTALVKVTNTAQDLGFPAKFEKLFTMSERFAYSHINFPSSARDSILSSYIKGKLEKVAGSKSAGNLMSNSQTRLHIVARIINQWISKHVLRRTCFSGLDKDIDVNIEMHAASIYQTTPAAVRGQLLSNITQEVGRLKARPDFQNFFFQRCKDRGNDLWAIVYPMMHRKTSKDWEDMMSLMVEAHNLAGMMLGGPYEWSFTFHDVGARFQQNIMINKDPFLCNLTPAELERRGGVVRLGISPLVGFRTYTMTGEMEASNVARAFVLTKWPQFG